jgi:flagellar basal-body rod protein FlgB
MFLSSLTDRGATPAMVASLSFNEANLSVIAENIANATTPGYRAKQLDGASFQRSLREALDRRGTDPNKPFAVRNGRQAETDRYGRLMVSPSERPVDNVLFHDGTNVSIEKEMADLAKTGMSHQLVSTMLKNRYDALTRVIRETR